MKDNTEHKTSNPGLIILQWLTYAFWGWTVFATSLLASNVLSHFLTDNNDDSFASYAIAAVLVLLPISIICNIFYTKKEPEKKIGAASIIMIIHAVLFALLSIGAVITIVVSLVQLLISSSDTTSTQIALYSAIIVAILYGVIFLRTLNIAKPIWFRKLFLGFMIITIGIISIFSVVGPVNGAIVTRDDRLIDGSLSNIQATIDNYVINQNQLPKTLKDIDLTGDAKKIVDNNLVQYTPNTKAPVIVSDTSKYYYQLCVTYKKKSLNNDIYAASYASSNDSDGYSSYVSTYYHPAGKYCYKLTSTPPDFINLEKATN